MREKVEKVYSPAEDSELLLDVALKEVKRSDTVLEVGTGSGFVAERLKGLCKLIVATDISPYAVREAKSRGVEVVRTDLFSGLKRAFTLVLFNPPYLELEPWERKGDWLEIAIDGGKGGIEVALRFVRRLNEVMLEEGRAIVILSSHSEVKAFLKECESMGYTTAIAGKKKLFFEELIAVKLRPKH